MQLKESKNKNTVEQIIFFYKKYKKKLVRAILFLLLIILFLGGYQVSESIQQKGYSGLWDFATTITNNYIEGLKANPEKISIEIKDNNLKKLEKYRKQALERNLIINDIDGDYVPATFEYQGKKIKIKLRLKGHMTDHLQENKWSFRIKINDDNSFMGMKRFSIQQPGTRGYVYEWIYHELMKREGIIALRYKFINVSVNGKDWGIYAVEENFDKELIENNHRIQSPVIRFNPDLYWVDRYNEIIRVKPVAEYASYYSANVEAYREEDVLKDSIQKKYYLKAISLMEGLRSKQLQIEEVFDIDKLAKFHAIIDLVGGQHSIDWSDIKYYYNPTTAKLEPVAYESFTQFPFNEIAGNYKYVTLDTNQNYKDLHTAIFSNTKFFKAYIAQLERISKPSYLNTFFDDSNLELKNNLSILYKEFPYKKFDKQNYYQNQRMIKKILSAPKAFHAYFNSVSNNQIHLQIGSIESLPVEIKSIFIGNTIIPISKKIILPSKQKNDFVHYQNYDIEIPATIFWNDLLIKSLKISYTILGASKEQETKVFPFPHTDSEFITDDLKNKKGNVNEFDFFNVDEISQKIYFKNGKHIIAKDIVIPEGYTIFANNLVALDFKNYAKIISYSSINFKGNEDENMMIQSSDSTGQGILVVDAKQKSIFENVTFKNLPKLHDKQWNRSGALTFYETSVSFNHCSFYNSKAEDVINFIRSVFSFKECLFHKTHDDAVDADFSEGTIENCAFENCNENAMDITMSKIKISSIYVNGSKNKAFNIKAGSELVGNNITIKNSNIAISIEDLSNADLKNVTISDCKYGLVAYKNKPNAGHPSLAVSQLIFKNIEQNYLREKKSSIIANGKFVNDEVDDVETVIKVKKIKHSEKK